MRYTYLLSLLVVATLHSCVTDSPPLNPPAEGFDMAGSDTTAIRIADEVMAAMGGRAAWDRVETIQWTFFGRRKHKWNKITDKISIETIADSSTITMILGDSTSVQASIGDSIITDPGTLQDYYQRGSSMWINDSYWLVMPYKLKDSGVTLNYVGVIEETDGRVCDKLRLTFTDVGDTPQNAYVVTIPRDTKLISQWEFYRSSTSTEAEFSTPWEDYQQYGDILLSTDRGRAKLTGVNVTMLDR